MGKRGPKPKQVVDTTWSANLAYAVGLIASDGCLATGQKLIDVTSVDKSLLENYKKCLGIQTPIGNKNSGGGHKAYRVQFKNALFYTWLQEIGLTPNKSKIIGILAVPDEYFFDFLRGVFDGDGTIYSYWDKRWKSSFMFYIGFISASDIFLGWLQNTIYRLAGIEGHISAVSRAKQLRFAKCDSYTLFAKMYYEKDIPYLERKFAKAQKIFTIDRRSCAGGETGKHAGLRG